MKATDARKYSPEQLEAFRQRAFELLAMGEKIETICRIFGVCEGTVYKWKRRAKQLSLEEAIKGGARGRPLGNGKLLTKEQEQKIREIVVGKNPGQMKFDFALWTRKAVRALIKSEFDIDISMSAVGDYLRYWGMTSQRPMKRAAEQNPERVKAWLEQEYPAISERSKKEGAIIYWADETAVKHDTNWVTGYSPKGKTPVLACPDGRWTTATMVSAISNQGLLRFKIQDKPMNQQLFVEFLEGLIHDEERKIFLIVDNLQVHKSRLVREWAEEHKERIELFFLPPYCPELNPDEYVNRAVKTEIRSRAPTKTPQLREKVSQFMEKMSCTVEWILNIFTNGPVAYAALNYK